MKKGKILFIGGVAFLVILVLFGGTYFMNADSDGIETGKVYALAYTYKATIKVSSVESRASDLYKATIKVSSVEGRVFDFADRNLPRTSILVPIQDARGIALTREIKTETMAPSTVRKMRIRVPAAKIEGVHYPAYEYVEWQYRLGTREVQTVVPTVIPRK